MRFVRFCLSLVGAMLAIQEIQGYPYQQPFWNLPYNSQLRPMKPASNATQFPWYYFHLWYPERFLNVSIYNVRPYASSPRLWKDNRPTGNDQWINSSNELPRTINFQPVLMIVFPTMPQQTTTQRERGTSPRNEEEAPIEKSEESSADRGVSSTVEYPTVFLETTTRPEEEFPTSEPIELDRESVSTVCQGNCKDAGEDDLSRLTEEALRNEKLLRSDEWISGQNATKHGGRESEQREKEDTRRKSTVGPADLERGPPCRENCSDNSGNDISRVTDKTAGSSESSRHDEWIGKRNTTKIWSPEGDDVAQESWDLHPAPICSNSTFCVHAAHYPEELVNRAIRRNDSLRLLQSVDLVSEVNSRRPRSAKFDELNDSPFCNSNTQVIYPRSAETATLRWLFIVNQPNLRQSVRIETCAGEGNACGELNEYLPIGYKASCKQKYIYRELMTVDNGVVKKDSFRFPSSCCCHREFIH
ncbi:PREDICTED: uncharacterized protein LOC105566969 [Vollenhovia emeryi]|uniref:uncharacterized protein LOC105566969 n=1 Tax=Vollenhovia emeryi TaxID=411798 RepID=UPI0005F4FBDF|nr:PREDICTED: uncharacterized protein LOC105566969 [Vollenhovia emeryi]